MNVELLNRVKEYILAEPLRLQMGNWLGISSVAPCGTAGCIAGHACLLAGLATKSIDGKYMYLPSGSSNLAQSALDLTYDQACRLFLVGEKWGDESYSGWDGHWPEEFELAYNEIEHDPEASKERAELAARRIEHFIKTEGRE